MEIGEDVTLLPSDALGISHNLYSEDHSDVGKILEHQYSSHFLATFFSHILISQG